MASVTIAFPALAGEARTPVFSYRDAAGKLHMLNTSAHKLTAVHFWATWCVPCVAELPEVDAAQARYASRGFQVIAISMDTKPAKVVDFFKERNIANLAVYLDNGSVSFQAAQVRGLPATLFFDSTGREIARTEGPMPWTHRQNIDFLEANLK